MSNQTTDEQRLGLPPGPVDTIRDIARHAVDVGYARGVADGRSLLLAELERAMWAMTDRDASGHTELDDISAHEAILRLRKRIRT